MRQHRKTTKENALKLFNELNLKYIEITALNRANIDGLFQNIAIGLYNLYREEKKI